MTAEENISTITQRKLGDGDSDSDSDGSFVLNRSAPAVAASEFINVYNHRKSRTIRPFIFPSSISSKIYGH